VATFYSKKNEVALKPGQTLGFTAGKGYYAAGTPTPPKPPPSATLAKAPTVAPTATRPVAAKTPATPLNVAKKAPDPRKPDVRDPADDTSSRSAPLRPSKPAAPKINRSTPFYTRHGEVPLKPSQTLAHEEGQGFYAAGRPNPTKAPSRPNPSTVKVTAVSTRASHRSPLVESRELNGPQETVRLRHREQPWRKGITDMEVLGRELGNAAGDTSPSENHRPPKHHSSRPASSLGGRHSDLMGHVAGGPSKNRHHKRHLDKSPTWPPPPFGTKVRFEAGVTRYAGNFKITSTFAASTKGIKAREVDGRLVFTAGDKTVYSVPLGALGSFTSAAKSFRATLQSLATFKLDNTPVTVHPNWPTGYSVTAEIHGVESTIEVNFVEQKVVFSLNQTTHIHKLHNSVDSELTVTVSPTENVPKTKAPAPHPYPVPPTRRRKRKVVPPDPAPGEIAIRALTAADAALATEELAELGVKGIVLLGNSLYSIHGVVLRDSAVGAALIGTGLLIARALA
jgi:hypothetical protein